MNKELIKTIKFSDLLQWDVKQFYFTKIKSKFKIEKLGKHLIHETKKYVLKDEPDKKYVLLGVSNKNGMFDADELYGKEINQKYHKVENNWLAYNPYRINVGSIGIKTPSLKGEYISPAYVVFSCRETVLPEYIYFLIKTDTFNKIINDSTTGTVRQTLHFDKLAEIEVPIPTIKQQEDILREYKETLNEIEKLKENLHIIERKKDTYLHDELGITDIEFDNKQKLFDVCKFSNMQNKWGIDKVDEYLKKAYKTIKYPLGKIGNNYNFVSRHWKKMGDKFNYIELGTVNSYTNIAESNELMVYSAPSRATQYVNGGDLIVGTTRPNLKRFALIGDYQNGYVCSSGFQVIEKSNNYSLVFLLEMLKTKEMYYIFENYVTGALYPAITSDVLYNIEIPIPPTKKQFEIEKELLKFKSEYVKTINKMEMINKDSIHRFENSIYILNE